MYVCLACGFKGFFFFFPYFDGIAFRFDNTLSSLDNNLHDLYAL